MREINKGDMPAFPAMQSVDGDWVECFRGMTLRQWYAGQALAAGGWSKFDYVKVIADSCFAIADAMLEAEK